MVLLVDIGLLESCLSGSSLRDRCHGVDIGTDQWFY